MTYKKVQNYKTPPSILAFSNGNFYGESITISNEKLQLDEDGERNLPNGVVVVKDTADKIRFLPRVKATEKITTSDSVLNVTEPFAISVGDELEIVLPYSVATVSGFTAGETVSLSVNEQSVSVVAEAVDADNSGVATKLKNEINSNRSVNNQVSAVSNGAEIYILGANITATHDIAVTSDVSLTLTLSHATNGKLTKESTSVGTVSSVDRANNTITLDANSAVEFIQDVPIGVVIKEIRGIIEHEYNMTDMTKHNFSLLTQSNGVFSNRMPYVDSDVKSELSGIRFITQM